MPDTSRPPAGVTGSSSGGEEMVLVVPRVDLERAEVLRHGFTDQGLERCLSLVARAGSFAPRREAEQDVSLKQIIPYAVVTHGESVFLFRRTDRGGEARLHGKRSIGVGGHINPVEAPPDRLVEAGLCRELEEELSFDEPYAYHPLGLVNDETMPVGRVHLGIVYRVEAGRGVRVREADVLEGGFVPVSELPPVMEQLESWSRLVAEALFARRGPRGAARP